ncbi:MAG: redoxin domain-containing protein [Dehalococcoidia bacterium]
MQVAVLVTLVLLAALTGLALLAVYNLVLQNGRMLLRVERIESMLLQPPDPATYVEDYIATLPPGGEAPPFELPDLDGVLRHLSEWRGQRVLLVFVDPECAFSRQLLPWLVGATRDVVPARPTPVLVSTGSLDANRALFDDSGFTGPVLLQRGTEVAAAYRVDGTPMSYLIDTDGVVATDVAVGVQSILLQAGEIGAVEDALDTGGAEPPRPSAELAAPVTLRDGLRRGDVAPLFRLPGVNAAEVSLLEFRGRPTVIVFTDPECEACDRVGPMLEGAHRAHPGLGVVMVSRGDRARTVAQVAEERLTLPIAVQRHWELSRRYGMFATPVAFLVDEWGVIQADPAVGAASIAELVEAAAAAAGR